MCPAPIIWRVRMHWKNSIRLWKACSAKSNCEWDEGLVGVRVLCEGSCTGVFRLQSSRINFWPHRAWSVMSARKEFLSDKSCPSKNILYYVRSCRERLHYACVMSGVLVTAQLKMKKVYDCVLVLLLVVMQYRPLITRKKIVCVTWTWSKGMLTVKIQCVCLWSC